MTPINFLDEGLKLLNFPPSLGKGLLNDKETLFTLLKPVLEEDQTLLMNKIDKVKNTYLALNEKPSTETFQHLQSEVICLHLFISKLKKGKSIKIGKVKESFDKVIQTLDTNPDLFELDPSFLTGYFNTLSQFLKHPDLAHEQKPKAKNDLIRQIIILKQAVYSSLLRIKQEQYMPTVTDYEASIHITFHFEQKIIN